MRPKTWAVLCYLAARPGVLVTKEELLDAVWGGIAVTEGTLTKSIGEIRDALHDEVRRPRFVETVHRRGFRFVSTIEEAGVVQSAPPSIPELPVHVIARQTELSRLHELLELVAGGSRQTAFVTGEAGIGKTTLIEAFVGSVARSRPDGVVVASGQCVHRHGGEEPLMPVLEAVSRLARGPHAGRVVQLLREQAPSWLVQLPWLVGTEGLQDLRAGLSGTTAARMLRVFAQLVEELTTDLTLVLVLEDLQWADPSTVDLVSILAQRPEPARLLLLGTYRPAEAIASAGPFDGMRRVLGFKRGCTELPLSLLPPAGVEAYLVARFGGHPPPPGLARLLHAQTEGNPLFLATAVDHLLSRGWLQQGEQGAIVRAELEALERYIPGSLSDLVEAQVLGLEQFEVAVLEAASVAGLEFGAQAVAAALDASVEKVEDTCERLVRAQRFLQASGTEAWPDGAVAARYAFAHAIYQRVFYHRIPAGRRRLLHQRIGERLEVGFGARAAEVAVELATHFERGRVSARAIFWLENAAASAEHRFAAREAAGFMRRALALLEGEPEEPERWRRELGLTSALGAALVAIYGFAAEEAWTHLERARDLTDKVGSAVERFRVTYMLRNISMSRLDPTHGPRLVKELEKAAVDLGTEEARLVTVMLAAGEELWRGKYAEAGHLTTVAAADPTALGMLVPGVNPALWASSMDAWRLWLIGRPEQARLSIESTIARARPRPDPTDLAFALFFAAQIQLWRGDLGAADALVDEGRDLATEHGFALWLAGIRGVAGGVLLARGDAAAAIESLRQSLEEFRTIGVQNYVAALLAGIAEASLRLGRLSEGLAAVEEGLDLTRTTHSRWQTPELWRVHGELRAAAGELPAAVASSFERAIEVAHSHGGLAFELRAATALARHLAARGRKAEARTTLAARYQAFTEGLDTADPCAARALLEQLAG